ncbi:MAG: hypothetical protein PHU12_03955 [Candidatus Aenigmarchaeota archaeon]|nr:hypothetical protein [Candidatus Aenigmarchaeota archaeon]
MFNLSNDNVGGGAEKPEEIGFLMTGKKAKRIIEAESEKRADLKVIEEKAKSYAATVMTILPTVKMTALTFGESYSNISKGLGIDFGLIVRGSVDQRRENLLMKALTDTEHFEGDLRPPGDIDWLIVVNYRMSSRARERLSKELKSRAYKVPSVLSEYNDHFDNDFDPRSIIYIDDLEEVLFRYDIRADREKTDHVLSLPASSVLVYEGNPSTNKGVEKHERIKEMFQRTRKMTGNPRNMQDYEVEWKKIVSASRKRFDFEPFIKSYIDSDPAAKGYF